MKKVTTLIIICYLMASSCSNTEEFQSIFNGMDLTGWSVKCTSGDSSSDYWFVEDSMIIANSMGDSTHDYVWLQYDRELRNFHLKFEFQPFRESTGNTGLQILSRYDPEEEWLNGPQVDIHPSGPWRTGMMWDETRGYQRWIFPDLPNSEWVNPEMALNEIKMHFAGDTVEWNRMEVRVEDLHVQAWLNDVQVTDFYGKGILDDSIHALKGVGTSGYLLFQIHNKDQLMARFRNIQLKTL